MNALEEKKENAEETGKVYVLVIEYIKSLAQKGEIAFGGKIPSERELMTTLGLSRNSIREALRSLENMGLIESRQGQGNFLVNHMGKSFGSLFSMLLFLNQSNYLEISQLRRFIETGAYALAVKQAQDAEIESLSGLVRKMADCSVQEREKLDKQFHDEMIRMSGNHLLEILNEALSELFENVIHEIDMQILSGEWDTLRNCHEEICKNLRKRSVQEGMDAIRRHYNILDRKLISFP